VGELVVKSVVKAFGSTIVLRDIDIEIGHGDFLVLVGPSGCGKSTLLSIIAGLDRQTAGSVYIHGRQVDDLAPKERDIAMVFQSYALYPAMSVEQNMGFSLEMGGVPKAERRERVAKVAKLLQIEHLLKRRPGQLSGGQRQRVAIGRALVREPSLFLFDEPLSNLDAKLRVEMRTEIKKLHQRLGTTIVYVTHDQVEAMTMATKIAVMKDGVIQQFGTPFDIYDRPTNTFVATFMGSPAMNLIPGRLEGLGASRKLLLRDGSTLPLPISTGGDAASKDVLLGLRPEWIKLADGADPNAIEMEIEVVEPTGPDIYTGLNLAGHEIMARLPANAAVFGRTRAKFAIDYDKTILFDQGSGKAIA
jgi:multiple sugar transport system ATP-binding protein